MRAYRKNRRGAPGGGASAVGAAGFGAAGFGADFFFCSFRLKLPSRSLSP